ncbi:MAG: DsbA family protein [Rhodobacteraceae bacterium]|nr:DsbA family protein [Paracoccaceae bacterium]
MDPKTRRMFLTVAGFGAAGLALNAGQRILPSSGGLDFVEMASPAGFRRLRGGGVSANAALLAGLDESETRPGYVPDGSICELLYGEHAEQGPGIAIFTDVNCAICRRFEPELEAFAADQSPALTTTYHELPRLAPSSEVAARAALAAGQQGAYRAFHQRLMRTRFQADRAFVARLADGIGLDPDRLIVDMDTPQVNRALAQSAYLAEAFGVPGTPTMVMGRTMVVGPLSRPDLNRLLRSEKSDPGVC